MNARAMTAAATTGSAASASVATASVTTAIGTIHAETSGQGPAVLLWPSIFSSHVVYRDLARLLGQDHRVVSIDPPGHGRSVLAEGRLDLQACAEATFALLDALGIADVAWVGTSWGGLVGVQAALGRPRRLRHLACLGTPFDFDPKPSTKTRLILALCRFVGTSRVFADGVARDFFLAQTRQRAEVLAAHRAVFREGDRRQLLRAARFIFSERESLLPMLGRVAVPTLVVAGRADPLYSVAMQRDAADRLPRGRFASLDAAHIAAVDRPVEVAALLREAWVDAERGTASMQEGLAR